MKSFPKKQNKDGFGIIEVIVAVGIITVGIIPIISLFTQNLNSEMKNENILIASYLANESIEIVRQERDDNWTAGDDWMGEVPNVIPTDGSEVIVGLVNSNDIRGGWDIEIPGVDKKKVYLSDDNYYVQSNVILGSWTETSFERYLEITENSGGGVAGCLGVLDCVEITSYVSFDGAPIVEITAYLYDGWK